MKRAGLCRGLLLLAQPFLISCRKEAVTSWRIASSPWWGCEPLYLALKISYLSDEGGNIFERPPFDIILASFRNRSADGGI